MINLGREFAYQTVDDVYITCLRSLVGRAIATRDMPEFTRAVFNLDADRREAVRIIDSNLSE